MTSFLSKNMHTAGGTNGYKGSPIHESVLNGFFTVDSKWNVQFWNKAMENLSGILSAEIKGKNLREVTASIIPTEFDVLYKKAFLPNQPEHFEEYWGNMGAWTEVTSYHNDSTLSVSFKGSKQTTDLVNQRLEALNELYKYVTEITNDCLWEWNLLDESIFWIDGGHKRVFGYPVENALIPQSFWEEKIHPDDKLRVLANFYNIITQSPGVVWEQEYRFKKANGDFAWVCDRGHIIYKDAEAVRIVGATQDISKRKISENLLLESEKKLSLIARETVNAVIITDADEKITWVNSAFTKITGYEPEEVMGRKPGSFLQGADSNPSTIDYMRRQIKQRQPFDCNIINYSKTGRKYWMHIQAQPITDENGNSNRFFAIETDITDKVELENNLASERQSKQKEITSAVLTAQENERADMGKELHDNLNQVLGATKLYIEMAKSDELNRDLYLNKASAYIVNVIGEIRKISKTLLPPGLGILGLFDSIHILLDDLRIIHPVQIDFDRHGLNDKTFDEKIQTNIFRILQEQMNNIFKHAGATQIAIDISCNAGELTLLISDNGNGAGTEAKNKGVGIRNIMSRAELCQGKAEIITAPGKGFQLKVTIPSTAAA